MDVSTEIVIRRPREEVAEWSADPARAPLWYKNIKRVEWETEPPLRRGSRIAFTAEFMSRQLKYTYEAVEYVPGERLVMRSSDGPMPMETIYEWIDAGDGRTRMRLRTHGSPAGFARLLSPFRPFFIRRENLKDLRRLKAILELRMVR